ncbi:hypothetical protein ABT218_12290 [Streptomyces sp. NPDC001455]|uniref:hypothetical protein n=1 Tax=Streptomyces sp. NPDC001455 TaxID=3154518 RepID=UPI003323881D
MAEQTLAIRESVTHTLRHTPAVVDVSIRLRQMAFLTSGAADELLIALDLVKNSKVGAGLHIQLAKHLTVLGAPTSVDLAESLTAEMRRQGMPLSGQVLQLSSADIAAMRDVACGKANVTQMLGRQYVTNEGGTRISINTVRNLEKRTLLHRHGVQEESIPQRLLLTAAGIRALASTFAQAPPHVSASGLQSVPPLQQQAPTAKRTR